MKRTSTEAFRIEETRGGRNGDDPVCDAYLRAVGARLSRGGYRDWYGHPIEPMRASERQAVLSALAQISAARRSGEEPRVNLTLAQDARKEVVLFLGLLPIVKAQSARFPRVLYLVADARLGARAQLALTSLRVGLPVDFGVWAGVVDQAHDGFRAVDLAGCWVIGDVDWSAEPDDDGRTLDDRRRGFDRVQRARVPLILVHQAGKVTLGDWPPPNSIPDPRAAWARTRA